MKNLIKRILKEEIDNIKGEWKNDTYILSDDKGRIGSGTLWECKDNSSGFYVREDGEPQYTIMALSVNSDHRGKGYAKEIIKQIENRCIEKNIDKLYILVSPINKAINIYKSMGYKEIPTKFSKHYITLVKMF